MLYEFEYQRIGRFPFFAPTGVSDEALMRQIQQRDEAALRQLHSRHYALLRCVISRSLFNEEDVNEVVQDAFCEIWRLADHYNANKGKALGWIITIARRRAIDRLRKKQSYQRGQDHFRNDVTNSGH